MVNPAANPQTLRVDNACRWDAVPINGQSDRRHLPARRAKASTRQQD
jgi:hypothetical protein